MRSCKRAAASRSLGRRMRTGPSEGDVLINLPFVQGAVAESWRRAHFHAGDSPAPRGSERLQRGLLVFLDVEELVVHGEAASEIVRVAAERKVDLIVISSHGRTGLGRILFGSTAESVVRHAPCPVLVVKPPPQGESEQ